MRMIKMTCMALAIVLMFGAISIPAHAAELENTTPEIFAMDLGVARATGSFNMSIPAKSRAVANSSFPLAAGETVTIKASYSPFTASLDFGLIDPNGVFYYFNITDGSIDKTIQVKESGDYILQVRNNSDSEVEVSGFVNY